MKYNSNFKKWKKSKISSLKHHLILLGATHRNKNKSLMDINVYFTVRPLGASTAYD